MTCLFPAEARLLLFFLTNPWLAQLRRISMKQSYRLRNQLSRSILPLGMDQAILTENRQEAPRGQLSHPSNAVPGLDAFSTFRAGGTYLPEERWAMVPADRPVNAQRDPWPGPGQLMADR